MDAINSINSMLIACVQAIGKYEADVHGFVDEKKRPAGSKFVGSALWPEKSVFDAQRLLLNSLNDDRPEKLSPDQAYLIEKMARERGIHLAVEFRCSDMGYSSPTPIEPEDEKAVLMRDFIQAQKAMSLLAEKLISKGIL